ADHNALGIFGYSFLFENTDTLQPGSVEGLAPDAETIADGSYSVSRPLFFYVKNAHRGVIPGPDDYVAEFVSEPAMGPDGYLSERGLIVLADDLRAAVVEAATTGTPMAAPAN